MTWSDHAATRPLRELGMLPDMQSELRALLKQVPAGKITTYGALARALGDYRASRWVGSFALDHDHGPLCPCHRIVRANGEPGLYITGEPAEKHARLRAEGSLMDNGRANLRERLVQQFQTIAPLTLLRNRQIDASREAILQSCPAQLSEVGGIDISYREDTACATLVCLHYAQAEPAWHHTVTQSVAFPYIPSYLAFRELPVYGTLLLEARRHHRLPTVIFVDGSGVLHPRLCGIATMLGTAGRIATIGITKKLLCGRYGDEELPRTGAASVVLDDRLLGFAVLGPGTSKRPLFVSPGHLMDVDSAVALTQRFWGKRRLPAPIYWADRISRIATQISQG